MAQRFPPGIYKFGSFALDAETGALLCGNAPTVLGQRGVALLRLLLERAASPVGKDALIEAAWPGLNVEESNLTVQIAALRRALEQDGGGRWIETLPRRGYRYVGPPVTRVDTNADEDGHRPRCWYRKSHQSLWCPLSTSAKPLGLPTAWSTTSSRGCRVSGGCS